MNINNKNIIENVQKKCSVCNNMFNSGITILGSFICEDCINKITTSDINDISYYKLKDQIKKIIMKNL